MLLVNFVLGGHISWRQIVEYANINPPPFSLLARDKQKNISDLAVSPWMDGEQRKKSVSQLMTRNWVSYPNVGAMKALSAECKQAAEWEG